MAHVHDRGRSSAWPRRIGPARSPVMAVPGASARWSAGPCAATVLVPVVVMVLVLAVVLVLAAPAGAHARLVGSTPEDGATVERAPAEVMIEVDAKPATTEGDPLQVYAPDGLRVDLGDPRVSAQERRLTVTLDHQRPLPAGVYEIAYRLVSADSHVIAGRLSFTARLPGGTANAADQADQADQADAIEPASLPDHEVGGGSANLVAGRPRDLRAPLAATGAVVLAGLTLLARRLRRPREHEGRPVVARPSAPEPARSRAVGPWGAPARPVERTRSRRDHRPRPRHRERAAARRSAASVGVDAWWTDEWVDRSADDEDGRWP